MRSLILIEDIKVSESRQWKDAELASTGPRHDEILNKGNIIM